MASTAFHWPSWFRGNGLYVLHAMARRRRERSLALLGHQAAEGPLSGEGARTALVQEVRTGQTQRGRFEAELDGSLQHDRQEYARSTEWARWWVIASGMLARAVIRNRRSQHERELRPTLVLLGIELVEGRLSATPLPSELARAQDAHARFLRLDQELNACLARVGGALYPRFVQVAVAELKELGRVIAKDVTQKMIPRLPALAGLLAGWGIAQLFTTSRWAGFLSDLGLRSGGPRVVSSETYERMQFWLPLLAAAICTYLGGRFSAAVRRKYAPATEGEKTVIAPPAT